MTPQSRLMALLSCLFALFGMGGLLAEAVPPAHAATFIVNSTVDGVDANPGDGICATAGGSCTLRAAVQEANALPGPDSIDLATGTYTLSLTGPITDTDAFGDLDIADDLFLSGMIAQTTIIDAQQIDRVLTVRSGVEVTLAAVTLRNGFAQIGGGLINFGSLNLIDVIVEDNEALSTGFVSGGGGIYSGGVLTGTNVLLDNNVSSHAGGGLFSYGQTTLSGSTISGNSAGTSGGGVLVTGGALTLQDTNVVNNAAADRAGGLEVPTGVLAISGGSISGNTAATFGGGLYLSNANQDTTISGVNWTNNQAQWGGALYLALENSAILLSHNDFDSNTAVNGGGALYYYGFAAGSALTLADVTFTANELAPGASSGGGALRISGENLSLTVTNSQFAQNVSPVYAGGAIANAANQSTVRLSQTTFISNTAFSGGALSSSGSFVTTEITEGTFTANTASGGSGGAIYYTTGQNATLAVAGSQFARNTAVWGGALAAIAAPTTIANSTFTANSATIDGGAILAYTGASLSNSTLSGNAANGSGGGLVGSSVFGDLLFNNVTLTANMADADNNGSGDGGGFSLDAGTGSQLQNSLIAGNVDGGGEAPDCAAALAPTSNGHNLVGQADGCGWAAAAGDLVGTAVSPIDPLLAPLAGSPAAHAPQAGSPAIDAGSSLTPGGGPPACAAADQLGTARPVDGDDDGTAVCDIGAVEYLPEPVSSDSYLFLPVIRRQ